MEYLWWAYGIIGLAVNFIALQHTMEKYGEDDDFAAGLMALFQGLVWPITIAVFIYRAQKTPSR